MYMVVKAPSLHRNAQAQAVALATYIEKPGNRGASFWLDGKDFSPRERAAILVALRDLQEEDGDP